MFAKKIDLFVQSLISGMQERNSLNDPAFFIQLLHESFIPYKISVTELKRSPSVHKPTALHFERLIEVLSKSIPPLPVPFACELGLVADTYLGNLEQNADWGGDVAWHFRLSSTLALQGRQLYSVVRFMRPEVCVEAGTAYGMSAMFLLNAMNRYSKQGCLHTIEGFEPQFSLSSDLLRKHFPGRVHSYKGLIDEALPKATQAAGEIDLFIHDAGHSRDYYVNEFGLVVDHLKPGAVVLIDDIRWDDARFRSAPSRCYEGWREVAAHPRVCDAVELDGNIGLLRLS